MNRARRLTLLGLAVVVVATNSSAGVQASAIRPVVFACCDFYNSSIYVVHGDGSGLRRLTRDAQDRDPARSPDGKTIVFLRLVVVGQDWRGDDVYRSDIYVLDPSKAPRLIVEEGVDFAWSPDSRTIAFVRDGKMWTASASTGATRRLTKTGSDFDPQWAPDGRTIAFGRADRIFVMNSDGSGQRRFAGSAKTGDASSPTWSPDGKWLAFVGSTAVALESGQNLYVVDRRGRGLRKLAGNLASYDGSGPRWSPDSRSILFEKDLDTPSQLRDDAYVVQLDRGGAKRVAARTYDPEWSPTGAQVAFRTRDQLHVVASNGRGARRISALKTVSSLDW